MSSSSSDIQHTKEQAFDSLFEISKILNTGLDRETLAILLDLCENGVNPDALAAAVTAVRKEAASMKPSQQ